MSLTVVFRETALRGLARIRSDDKDLFTRMRQAITHLADHPRPENAVAWGTTDARSAWAARPERGTGSRSAGGLAASRPRSAASKHRPSGGIGFGSGVAFP